MFWLHLCHTCDDNSQHTEAHECVKLKTKISTRDVDLEVIYYIKYLQQPCVCMYMLIYIYVGVNMFMHYIYELEIHMCKFNFNGDTKMRKASDQVGYRI